MKSPLSFLPHAASTMAAHVDALSIALLISCGLTLFLLTALIGYFGVKYRKGSPHSRHLSPGEHHWIEWLWTGATFFAFILIFIAGSYVYLEQHSPPPGAMVISVIGKQWMWKFQHPSGVRELNELHVPIGVPIVLSMSSQDVIHSLFIPAFRIKQDILPDRYTKLWFKATKLGEFHLFCTQYCGSLHSGMRGKVVVMTQENYERWLRAQGMQSGSGGSPIAATRGRELFTRLGCISCHGENPGVRAPSLAGIYGKTVGLSDGTTTFVDESYIRESILNPKAKIVQGYQDLMPSFAKLVNEEDVLDLIAYIKSLQGTPKAETPGLVTGGEK